MKKALLILLLLSLGVLVSQKIAATMNKERTKWVEGNFSVSPDKKWGVYLQSSSDSDPAKSFCRISLFASRNYPDIVARNAPSRFQENNPTASFLVPIRLYARMAAVEFDSESDRVLIKQGPVNGMAQVAYEVDLGNYSLTARSPDSTGNYVGNNRISESSHGLPDSKRKIFPNDSGAKFTLYIRLAPPYKTNGAVLQTLLETEGYESYREGEEEISIVVDERMLYALFHARIHYRQVVASASNGFVSEPVLEGIEIPGRFAKMVHSVYMDPGRG